MIKIEKLNKLYNKKSSNKLHVLKDISLELPDKGMIAIFGRSGCGKTTLLNAIGGLDRTDSGSITVNGERMTSENDVLRNKSTGYIFQNYNLNVLENCYDNVADALRLCGITDKEVIRTRTMAALKNVGMENYKFRTPDTLSGGQMQRIAIARAIVKNPHIILADEPTGNLDEANTVMIMDLLKQISLSHLVILVTHEASLVDHYCDRVIELFDGKVANERINDDANGYTAKSKNDIYLGELERTELTDKNIALDYYGEGAEAPIKLSIVKHMGKTYLRVDTPGVQVLDQSSEIRLHEGIYKETQCKNELSEAIDMSPLPPIDGSNYGRLFSFKSSLKSGYEAIYSKKKKSIKLLRSCMLMFACVIVFMSSLQGTVFRDYFEITEQFNQNVFYVYTPSYEIGEKLIAATGSNGIDYTRIAPSTNYGDLELRVDLGNFETYGDNYFGASSIQGSGVMLPYRLCAEMKTAAGVNEPLKDGEIIITTATADKILKNSGYGFIKEYGDLVGFVCHLQNSRMGRFIIKGIVQSNETAFYINENIIAKFALMELDTSIASASTHGVEVKPGEIILRQNKDYGTQELPLLGESIKILGNEYKVADIQYIASDYRSYLELNGYTELISEMEGYYDACIKNAVNSNPNIPEYEAEYLGKREYFKTYFDMREKYYSHLDEYIKDSSENPIYRWIYETKGVEYAKYLVCQDTEMAAAVIYRDKEGRGEYPDLENMPQYEYSEVEGALEVYFDEYYNSGAADNEYAAIYDYAYLMCDEDIIRSTAGLGESAYSAVRGYIDYSFDDSGLNYSFPNCHMIVHSNDVKATEEYLLREFGNTLVAYRYQKAVATPSSMVKEQLEYRMSDIISGIVTILSVTAVMCVCMYIIMRSALMGRVKEIGIYRAIGVSKKNLMFRFFVEALVLTTLTVFIGYIVSSFVIAGWLAQSPLISEIFYYPVWMALTVLTLLYAVCVICGCLPIFSLLRKTPSEILAKYDI